MTKKISMIHQQGSLVVEFTTFMHQYGWQSFACTLQYHQTIIFNSVYQWSRIYALKSKSVLEMHIPMIWRFKFTDLVNSKKTESLWKNDCRQKYLDKNLLSYKLLLWQWIVIYKKTSLWRLIPFYWNIPFLFLGM